MLSEPLGSVLQGIRRWYIYLATVHCRIDSPQQGVPHRSEKSNENNEYRPTRFSPRIVPSCGAFTAIVFRGRLELSTKPGVTPEQNR